MGEDGPSDLGRASEVFVEIIGFLCYLTFMATPFSQIIGHKRILDYLERAHASGRLAHAYLFEGAEHLGKTSVAEIFASLILGIEDGGKLASHPDFFLLEPGINEKTGKAKKNIGIDEVRELTHRLSLSPMRGGAKAAIISAAETLSAEAANALLKTLEEPAGKSFIILVSSSSDALPPTVVSRTQIIRFGLVPREVIERELVLRGESEALAREISKLAFGRPGIALKHGQDAKSARLFEEEFKRDMALVAAPLFERFKFVQKNIPENSVDVKERAESILNRWELIFRDMLAALLGAREVVLHGFAEESLFAAARSFGARGLLARLNGVAAAREAISENVAPRFVLENFFLNL